MEEVGTAIACAAVFCCPPLPPRGQFAACCWLSLLAPGPSCLCPSSSRPAMRLEDVGAESRHLSTNSLDGGHQTLLGMLPTVPASTAATAANSAANNLHSGTGHLHTSPLAPAAAAAAAQLLHSPGGRAAQLREEERQERGDGSGGGGSNHSVNVGPPRPGSPAAAVLPSVHSAAHSVSQVCNHIGCKLSLHAYRVQTNPASLAAPPWLGCC